MKRKLAYCLGFLVISISLMACGSPKYKNGSYTGTGKGYNGDIKVNVTVSANKISSIEVKENNESKSILQDVINDLIPNVISEGSTEVDVISGATGSSNGVIEAINNALKDAK